MSRWQNVLRRQIKRLTGHRETAELVRRTTEWCKKCRLLLNPHRYSSNVCLPNAHTMPMPMTMPMPFIVIECQMLETFDIWFCCDCLAGGVVVVGFRIIQVDSIDALLWICDNMQCQNQATSHPIPRNTLYDNIDVCVALMPWYIPIRSQPFERDANDALLSWHGVHFLSYQNSVRCRCRCCCRRLRHTAKERTFAPILFEQISIASCPFLRTSVSWRLKYINFY